MDCKRIDDELIAFHLGALDGPTRAAVEAHLCGCGRCVGAYLMLKRAVDVGEDAPAPSELTRSRVLAAARRELVARSPAARSRRIVIWATAAAMLVAAPLLWRATAPRVEPEVPAAADVATPDTPLPAGTTRAVDTARATPENLRFL